MEAKTHIIDGLRKLRHPNHPSEGWSGYMHSVAEQDLVSNICFDHQFHKEIISSVTAITDTEQRVKESKRKALKDIKDNYKNIKAALMQLFERVIDDVYHTGATCMGQQGFGVLMSKQIMYTLMALYRKTSLPELEMALRRLLEPMHQTKPIEVILQAIEGRFVLLQ